MAALEREAEKAFRAADEADPHVRSLTECRVRLRCRVSGCSTRWMHSGPVDACVAVSVVATAQRT
jgi:hypothetical protein